MLTPASGVNRAIDPIIPLIYRRRRRSARRLFTRNDPVNVLYEEDGSFKAGTVLADGDTSLQIEAPHGKRAKIKAKDVLIRFDDPSAAEVLAQAERLARDVDLDFLWQ